jgi:hypothetical protein
MVLLKLSPKDIGNCLRPDEVETGFNIRQAVSRFHVWKILIIVVKLSWKYITTMSVRRTMSLQDAARLSRNNQLAILHGSKLIMVQISN